MPQNKELVLISKMKIEILGMGCVKCNRLEENAKKAIEELGIDAKLEHVADMSQIIEYGVMATPALVIDGDVKCAGRTPDVDEIKGWLE